MSVLTPNQEIFSAHLAAATGLDRNVVRGWVISEESDSAARSRDASGNQNWLNLGVGPSGDRFNPGWTDPIQAANNTAAALKGTKYKTGDFYAGIMASAGGHPGDQIKAIAESPWDKGHYNGGSSLVSAYHLVSGLPAPKINTGSTPSVTSTTSTQEKAVQTPHTPSLTGMTEIVAPSPVSYLKGSRIALPDVGGNTPAPAIHLAGSKIPLPSYGIDVPVTLTPVTTPKATTPLTPKATAPTPLGTPGGGWGGTLALANVMKDIGAKYGLTATGKRNTKMTASGGISDHWVGSKNAFAYDLSNGTTNMDPAKDKTAMAIATALGARAQWIAMGRKGILNVTKNGYRYQMIYGVTGAANGGNHLTHVHIGIRKVAGA